MQEREELKTLLEEQQKRVQGMKGELVAVDAFQSGLDGEQSSLSKKLRDAQAQLEELESQRHAELLVLAKAPLLLTLTILPFLLLCFPPSPLHLPAYHSFSFPFRFRWGAFLLVW